MATKKLKKIYLIGSMRNKEIPKIAISLRKLGFDVFDDWHAPGEQTDDEWMRIVKSYMSVRRQNQISISLASWNPYHYGKWRKKINKLKK